MYIDYSYAPLIGYCKQPIKYADLPILLICEDTSPFLRYGLFEIFHLHSFCLPIQNSAPAGLECLVLWVFLIFFNSFFSNLALPPPQKKILPLYIFKFSNSPRLNYFSFDLINLRIFAPKYFFLWVDFISSPEHTQNWMTYASQAVLTSLKYTHTHTAFIFIV